MGCRGVGVTGVQWRASVSALLVAAVVVTAGCGSDDSDTEAQPTAQPEGTAGSFDWVMVEMDRQLETAVALGDGFVGQTVDVKPDYDETSEDFPFVISVVVSPDGVTWTEPDIPVLQPDEGAWWASGGPWGAVATLMSPTSESPAPDLLFTPDGEQWMRGRLPDDVLAKAEMGFGPESYAVGAAGLMVAAVFEGPEGAESVVLLTEDLQEWRSVEHPLPASREMWLEVAANADGDYLLSQPGAGAAEQPAPIIAYTSSDGQSWEPVTSTEEYQIVGWSNDWSTGWRDGFAVVAEILPADSGGSEEGMGQPQMWLSTADGAWEAIDMSAIPVSHLAPGDYHGSSLGLLASGGDWPEEGEGPGTEDTSLLYTADGQTWQAISTRDTFDAGGVMPVVLGETKLLVGVIPETGGEGEQVIQQLWLGTPTEP